MTCPPLTISPANEDDLVFDESWDPARNALLMWEEIVGWFETPLRQDRIPLGGGDGELIVSSLAARPIVITAFAGFARDVDYWACLPSLRAFCEDLVSDTAAATLGTPVDETLTVNLAPGQMGFLRRGVIRDTGLLPSTEVRMGFRFQVHLIAADPHPA